MDVREAKRYGLKLVREDNNYYYVRYIDSVKPTRVSKCIWQDLLALGVEPYKQVRDWIERGEDIEHSIKELKE